MMRIQILIISLFFAANLSAQKIQILKKGHSFYKQNDYQSALAEYEKLWYSSAGAKILGVDGKMNLADCYLKMDKPFKALDLYRKVMPYFSDRIDSYLKYGEVLMTLGRYSEAVSQFEKYAEINPEDSRAEEYIKRIDAIRDIQPLFMMVDIIPQNMVNDSLTEQLGVTYYGDAIVFASNQVAGNPLSSSQSGVYNMRISGIGADGNLKPSEKFSVSLNGEDRNDGPATFSRDGRIIYYSKEIDDPSVGKKIVQIYISTFADGSWSEAKPLPVMFQGKEFTQPSLSGDGKQLYFASNMKGSVGGLDIWFSAFEDGHWTYPRNLGPDINTPEDDGWPYIHPDGDLYFSSKGHGGFGGHDIFRTRPLGNGVDWLDIENLGDPFNTSFNDISFIMSDDQTQGFLASNRNRSYDIYRFVLNNAEPQDIPAELGPRASIGISEISVHGKLDDSFPEQKPDETDEEYIERMQREAEANATNNTASSNNTSSSNNNTTANNNTSSNNTSSSNNNTTANNNTSSNNTSSSNNNTTTNNNTSSAEKVELIVKLQVLDGYGKPLPTAQVDVENKYTGKRTTYNVNSSGLAEIHLEPNQKYNMTGRLDGYQESSMPVSTMGATSTQTVAASLELKKQ